MAWLLAAVLVLGAALRVIYYREIRSAPEFGFPAVDAGYHDAWARAAVSGDWNPTKQNDVSAIPGNAYLRPPGYTWFLIWVYRIFGPKYAAVRIAQMGLGLLNIVLAFALGRRLFDMATGLIWALMMAVYWAFIYFEGELLEPTVLITLSLALMLALEGWRRDRLPRQAISVGVWLGLFAVTRPNILLFAPVVLLWLGWNERWAPVRAVRASAFFILGMAVIILPVTLRNIIVAGDLVLISSNAGINLYIGNNEQADGLFIGHVPGSDEFGTSDVYPEIVQRMERKEGRRLKYSEVSRYFSRQAWDYIRAHPRATFRLLVRKALLFWGPLETGHNKSIYYDRAFSRLLSRLPLDFAVALALALLGAATCFWRHAACAGLPRSGNSSAMLVLILLFILVYFASFLPFFVTGQYRVPVIPFLMLFAAWAVRGWFGLLAGRRGRAALAWLAGLALLYACVSVNYAGFEPNLAKWHFDRGTAFGKQGRTAEAEQSYRAVISADPASAEAWMNLGLVVEKRAGPEAAEPYYRRALELRPDLAKAYNNLGNNLFRQHRLAEAVQCYQSALTLRPSAADVHKNLAAALLVLNRPAEAVPHFEAALRLDPDSPRAEAGLAEALGRLDRKAEAAEHFRRAWELQGKKKPPNLKPEI